MLVELHSHTTHSHGKKIYFDGVEKPEEMVRHAARLGIDAIAITDHNVITGALAAKKFAKKHDVKVFVGEEITTEKGHMLGLGLEECIRPGLSVMETIDKIHEQGGIAIAPHPFDINNDGLKEESIECDALEVFNGMSLDRIANFKAKRFAEKNKKQVTAGSDAHLAAMIGHGLVSASVYDIDGLVKAIKKGRIKINTKYPSAKIIMDYSVKRLQMSYDKVWDYIENNYTGPKKRISKKMLGLVKESPGSIDILFSGLTYFSLGIAILYGTTKEVSGFFNTK